MQKYIEREALLKSDDWQSLKSDFDKARAHIIILGQPAADVVEVRHGKWIKGRKEKLYYNDDMSGFYDFPVTCSVCKFDITDEGFYETDFCPNCGAKMDGEKNEAN